MPIGIAGDTPTTVTTALTPAAALDLLNQLLIELRTNTVVCAQGLNVPDDLAAIRIDQDLEVVSGTGYNQG